MEWVILENIKNIHLVNVDGQTKLRLKDHFKRICRDEKKARDYIEKSSKESSINFRIMENREEVAEDAH
jgi:hypothetical protein